jgi:hypothetical protein
VPIARLAAAQAVLAGHARQGTPKPSAKHKAKPTAKHGAKPTAKHRAKASAKG